MSANKLDPDWVVTYLEQQEKQLNRELSPELKDEVTKKLREMALILMYKQSRRFVIYYHKK